MTFNLFVSACMVAGLFLYLSCVVTLLICNSHDSQGKNAFVQLYFVSKCLLDICIVYKLLVTSGI